VIDDIEVKIAEHEGPKCPRCYKHSHEGRFNFDGLCDRCQDTILTFFPTHESVPFIEAALAEQRKRWGIE